MIEVKNLTKTYGSFTAVDHISFTIKPGKIYGLLGPNGAGKSTTMNMITGCLSATSGEVLVCGHDIFEEPEEAKRHIGYLPEIPPLYPDMTPYEYLLFVAEAKGVPTPKAMKQVEQAMKLTQLEDMQDRLIRNLSKGYRQRVGISQAMLGNPDIIILDEPTVGLDPKQIIEIRDLIRRLGQIKTVILSSHILAEISAVCDHIMIMSHGKLVANDTAAHLEQSVNENSVLTVRAKGTPDAVVPLLEQIPGIRSFSACPGSLPGTTDAKLTPDAGKDPGEALFFAFSDARIPLLEIHKEILTLEDIFLRLTDDSPLSTEDRPLSTEDRPLSTEDTPDEPAENRKENLEK